MVNIVAAGIGYGVKEQFGGYSFLQPSSLSDFREQLKDSGVIIRDVLGYVLFDQEQPSKVTMMIQTQDDAQCDSDTKKGDIANLWPAGGKIDKPYIALAEAGIITIEQAYAASGFVGEMDEFDGPKGEVVTALNRAYGLPHGDVLGVFESPRNRQDLYIDNSFVRRFEKTAEGAIRQLISNDLNFNAYNKLTSMVASYAMGIDPRDTKNGELVVTSVANLWIPSSEQEIDKIAGYVANSNIDNILSMDLVDITSFGAQNPTTVSNMVASSLYLNNFTALTGLNKPNDLPRGSDIEGFKNAVNHSGETIEQIVQRAKDWQF